MPEDAPNPLPKLATLMQSYAGEGDRELIRDVKAEVTELQRRLENQAATLASAMSQIRKLEADIKQLRGLKTT